MRVDNGLLEEYLLTRGLPTSDWESAGSISELPRPISNRTPTTSHPQTLHGTAIFAYMDPQNHTNVGINVIHGVFGIIVPDPNTSAKPSGT